MEQTLSLSSRDIEQFHDLGFLSIPRITTHDEIAHVRGLYDRLFEQRAGWNNGDFFDFAGLDDLGTPATVPQLSEPSRYEPALKDMIFRKNAHALAQQLLGPGAELVFEHAILKPAGIGGETPWHQDEAFYPRFTNYRSLTFWMPLQPVDQFNGCLEFIPHSNNGPLLQHRSIKNDKRIHGLEALGVDESGKVICPLDEGGATVHGYRTLHHAAPNRTDGPRRAYALAFGVRSKAYTLREEFPWNLAKETAREKRAASAQGIMGRYLAGLKKSGKTIIR
ncbi:MAG: phytanoyl-CoA dioxygenase family protein [Burkholderiales bacterium]|nr:phytanoyl-CoA dioxygenase family protein [Burkholderiales bacterium]